MLPWLAAEYHLPPSEVLRTPWRLLVPFLDHRTAVIAQRKAASRG